MPETGDVQILQPSCVKTLVQRRKVSMALDFSDSLHVPKKCKLDNFINKSTSAKVNNSSRGIVRKLEPSELIQKLERSQNSILLVDCRSFISFNVIHIQGAVNVSCADRFNRKRLQQGKVTLVDLFSSKEGRDQFKRRASKEIILYDDGTKELQKLSPENSLYTVLSSLISEGKDAFVLNGKL